MRRSVLSVIATFALLALPARAEPPAPALAAWTASPVAPDGEPLDAVERAVLARCGRGESGLMVTARGLLARKVRDGSLPELDGVARLQRTAGEPHPWARVWAATGKSLDATATVAKLGDWLGPGASPRRRCGVASGAGPQGARSVVVVAVEALADLAPLPTRARTGQWLNVEAHLGGPAAGAQVVALDPGGAARTVPSWVEGSTVRARVLPTGPGELALQVLADVGGGPRPVLEAVVLVDVDPRPDDDERPAPGEISPGPETDDDALARMLAAARATVGLGPLPRDPRLDAVARAHAQRMARARELAHDVGDGDPARRVQDAGLDAHRVGENVAHAPTAALADRAFWESPSHRMNLLGRDFDRVGIGVALDEHGDAWVVETFAGPMIVRGQLNPE